MEWLLRISDRLRHNGRLRRGNAAHAWGRRGEDLAHRYLRSRGYVIVARNYRNRCGSAEIDLVARDGETLVFVEVKSRSTDLFGAPEQAVDEEKRRRILRGARDYIYRAGLSWDRTRFDIVSVLFGGQERIEHHIDAFRPPDSLL